MSISLLTCKGRNQSFPAYPIVDLNNPEKNGARVLIGAIVVTPVDMEQPCNAKLTEGDGKEIYRASGDAGDQVLPFLPAGFIQVTNGIYPDTVDNCTVDIYIK